MKYFRYFLFPLSVLYGCILSIRNFLYNHKFLKSKSYSVPVICVGNLNTGGTGKTPMIELLVRTLGEEYNLATLSRGYKRTTKGFIEVNAHHSSSDVGDEPLQFKNNFPDLKVAVDANRQRGISNLLRAYPKLDMILLDDAFQHRKVKPDFSIVLTTYKDLYVRDFVLPTGNLREFQTGAKRADMIIVTKCPKDLSRTEQKNIALQLRPKPYQKLLFSTIFYSEFVTNTLQKIDINSFNNFTLVTGIANPSPLVSHLKALDKKFSHEKFPDHHEFSAAEIQRLQKIPLLLTTQKDYMRLKTEFSTEKLFYLPIESRILNDPDSLKLNIEKQVFDHLE
ncbi:tetraacyldisaccharide 4'-kinase [Psychroflexus gondwanensis]|uniref:tetraacyldisaccharide 4'-kinase n=1 Tax=Psychroflexus gondwanensis TaxID=251 RepID=UPI0011BEC097|nr:tetraacyldisaccharide 4'-kinase [Psychroflexus gondwanensis]TXE18249.1 tetraacyldisaccharide 4'-kinase [Psychroflexus gondwanensis]